MIRVIGDTTSGYNLEQAKALGIEFIPQLVVFGEKTYRDDTEMSSAMYNAINKMALGEYSAEQAYDEMAAALDGLLKE